MVGAPDGVHVILLGKDFSLPSGVVGRMVLALNKEGWATSAGSEESLRTFPQMSPSQIFLTRALTLVKQTCLG